MLRKPAGLKIAAPFLCVALICACLAAQAANESNDFGAIDIKSGMRSISGLLAGTNRTAEVPSPLATMGIRN